MRIYTKAGDLAFSTFTFPDGQPHFKLETYELDFNAVTVETAIKSPADLFMVLVVSEVLRQHGYKEINLDIRYLMGARMDRAISSLEPFTLQTVARLINGAGFSRVRILDVHSEVALRLIRNSENVLPKAIFKQVSNTVGRVLRVAPDKGAADRVYTLAEDEFVLQCSKERNPADGTLGNFAVPGLFLTCAIKDCLIIDDICDGGGTFVGLAEELWKAGAKKVYLFVTHGIFSKGLPLGGINRVFTTDSYFNQEACSRPRTVPYCFDDARRDGYLTVIPISMKDIT